MTPATHELTKTSIRTNSGIFVDLAQPKPSDMRLCDIAYSLSRLERYTGHNDMPCNVAAHSVAVMREVRRQMPNTPERVLRAALLHDAAEAYVGDLNRPAKEVLRAMSEEAASAYDRLEGMVMACVNEQFDCPLLTPWDTALVKRADEAMFEEEYRKWTLTPWQPGYPLAERAREQFIAAAAEVGIAPSVHRTAGVRRAS